MSPSQKKIRQREGGSKSEFSRKQKFSHKPELKKDTDALFRPHAVTRRRIVLCIVTFLLLLIGFLSVLGIYSLP